MGSRKNGGGIVMSLAQIANVDPNYAYPEITKELRAYVLERDHELCQMCGKIGSHLHHVIFKSFGGTNAANNLITLCVECHTGDNGIHKHLGPMCSMLLSKIEFNENRFRKKLSNSFIKRI